MLDDDVARLQVAVHDARRPRVEVGERVAQPDHDLALLIEALRDGLRGGQPEHLCGECLAVDSFQHEHDVAGAGVDARSVEEGYVLVAHLAHDAELVPDGGVLRTGPHLVHLDRHRAAAVRAAADHAEAAPAQDVGADAQVPIVYEPVLLRAQNLEIQETALPERVLVVEHLERVEHVSRGRGCGPVSPFGVQ
eukprot:1625156-Heterocapsa_arctica.AAC.1